MVQDLNNTPKTYLANVSIAEAITFDPEHDDPDDPSSWDPLSAKDFDKETHGHLKFFCPCCLDNGDFVKLKNPSGEYYQNITFDLIDKNTQELVIDPSTNEPKTETRRYLFPARFSLFPQEKHTCDLAENQNQLSQSIKDNDGVVLNSAAGAYIVNLNIPAGQKIEHRRPRRTLTETGAFNNAAQQNPSDAERRIHKSSKSRSTPRSHGVKSVQALANFLDKTEFDREQREAILLRYGNNSATLKHAYQGNTLDMYRTLYKAKVNSSHDPDAEQRHLALFRFRPNGNRKFWNKERDGSMSVKSHPEQVRDKEGNKFYVSTRLNFQTEGAYEAFKDAYDQAESKDDRWFLVYAEDARVNIDRFEKKKEKVVSGTNQSATVYVNATVFDKEQITQWSPKSPQLLLDFGRKQHAEPVEETFEP